MRLRAALLASAVFAAPALAEDPEFLVFDWAGFEDPGLYAAYADKHGTAPAYTFFGDDDEAYQKVASGFRADVGHPCSQMVSKYRDAGLIEPWDVSRIPEFASIDPKFLASPIYQDETGVWFIPTDWGATAIAYNTDAVPAEDVASLNVFLNPAYAGRISLPDNTDDVWSLALLANGVTDWTQMTDADYEAAANWIRAAHENVRAYWTDPGELAQLMASGEVLVAWTWPDPVTLLKEDGFPVGYTREAAEGSASWFCGYVNFKDAPGNEDKAYDFINSWLRPDAGRVLLDGFGYGHASLAAQASISAEELTAAGLGTTSTPVLAQVPMDQARREQLLETFERIKAGF
jgi:spermidine/putrescine transport system substrate-binding protein